VDALGWTPGGRAADFSPAGILEGVRRFREPVHIVRSEAGHEPGLGLGGVVGAGSGHELVGTLPALYPEWLGDRSFNRTHGVRFPYVAGEMANGIATVASVVAMARARMLGFFGAAGLALPAVERAVGELRRSLPGQDNWGVTAQLSVEFKRPVEVGVEIRASERRLDDEGRAVQGLGRPERLAPEAVSHHHVVRDGHRVHAHASP